MSTTSRRRFLTQSLVAAGSLGLGYFGWSNFSRASFDLVIDDQLGMLRTVNDLTTGLPLLNLPKGYSYLTFAWAGDKLADGSTSPGSCDGMGVVSDENGIITLVRNHELRGSDGAFGSAETAWDNTGGGTTTLCFDSRSAKLLDSRVSLSGTLNNCAGGVTPWGTWLSCEESLYVPKSGLDCDNDRQRLWQLDKACKSHGYVFEVPPDGAVNPKPIVQMGQFYHEAVAVDPSTGVVYQTEDNSPNAGFYRYLPDVPGNLIVGGRLQMLEVIGHKRLNEGIPANVPMACKWVDIAKPDQGHSPGTSDAAGVVSQGMGGGGTAFIALEGCVYDEQAIYFTSKSGGEAGAGQIFRFDIQAQTVEKIFEASDKNTFSGLDNLIMSPQGSLMVCEDRYSISTAGQHIAGMDPAGRMFAFCQLNPDIACHYAGHNLSSTAAHSEWAGVCFSADGKWMFANIYNPGVTVAITGPWSKGPV